MSANIYYQTEDALGGDDQSLDVQDFSFVPIVTPVG